MEKEYQILRKSEPDLMLAAEHTTKTTESTADPSAETRAVDTTKTADTTETAANSAGTDSTAGTKSTAKSAARHHLIRRVTQAAHLSLVDELRLVSALLHVSGRCSRARC